MTYGYSGRVGCGMTKFVDYAVGEDRTDSHRYNAVMFVCDTSYRPTFGEEVYNTDGSRGYCMCTNVERLDRVDDCLCSDRTDPVDHPIERPPVKCNKTTQKDRRLPAVVLMPIVAVEDADPNTQQHKRVALNELKQNLDLRRKIKDRVEIVRNRYFKNYFIVDPGTRFPNNGPIDNNTFILFKPEPLKADLSRKATGLKIPTKRKRNTIKPRRDFSNMDHLVSEYLSHKRNNKFNSHIATDVASYNDTRDFADATITPVDPQNYEGLSARGLQYGVRGTPKTVAEYNKNINKMVEKNMLKAREDIPGTYNHFLRPIKDIREGDLMRIIDHSNIDHEKKSIGAQRNTFASRIQNPLRIHAYDKMFDYNKPLENNYRNVKYDNPSEMLINSDYEDGHIQNGDANLDIISSGDNRGLNGPYVYGADNGQSRIYLDRANYRRPLKHHDKNANRFDHRRRVNEPRSQEQHYLMPDRLNHMREL